MRRLPCHCPNEAVGVSAIEGLLHSNFVHRAEILLVAVAANKIVRYPFLTVHRILWTVFAADSPGRSALS